MRSKHRVWSRVRNPDVNEVLGMYVSSISPHHPFTPSLGHVHSTIQLKLMQAASMRLDSVLAEACRAINGLPGSLRNAIDLDRGDYAVRSLPMTALFCILSKAFASINRCSDRRNICADSGVKLHAFWNRGGRVCRIPCPLRG